MRTIKIKVHAEIPFASSGEDYRENDEIEFEVQNDTTEEEIEKLCEENTKERFYDMYNYSYERIN